MAESAGTLWGARYAVLEYVDHQTVKGSRIAHTLFGDVMELKMRAYRFAQAILPKAA